MSIEFTTQDIQIMNMRGNDPNVVAHQFNYFTKGFDFAQLDRSATIGDGIKKIDETEQSFFIKTYQQLAKGKKIMKFVPASGAASRMFKAMYEAIKSPKDEKTQQYVAQFLASLPRFAFYETVKEGLAKQGVDIEHACKTGDFLPIFNLILNNQGMNYGNLPKGVLLFHKYNAENRTAFEEHLVEAANYAKSEENQCYIHFTVSPQHQKEFDALIESKLLEYEKRYKVIYHVSFSNQDLATDTMAAQLDNTPFRDENGNLFFRPAGHGALINNLNQLDGDVIFVKNIDNVTTEDKLTPTINSKQVLAGLMLRLQQKTFQYLEKLTKGETSKSVLDEVTTFAQESLCIQFAQDNPSLEEIVERLNRPIRVCGVVKNEGEPGGGPFWVTNNEGKTSCQIVETSQINLSDEKQLQIVQNATHFNPVDMVCGIKNYEGNLFNLTQYVDPLTGFISEKSQGSHTIKVMELPGLWNGAMADWITIFVEVPLATFNPVKTVTDLLKR